MNEKKVEELDQAIREEWEHVEETLDELLANVSSMTVSEALAARDRVIHSSIQWFVHYDSPRQIKDQRSFMFLQNLLETADSHLATKMFKGY